MKKKLQLEELRVKSFVTRIQKTDEHELMGGAEITNREGVCGQVTLFHSMCRTCEFVCYYETENCQ